MRYLTWVRAKLDVTAINGSTASHNGHLEDVNDDGIADLVAHLNHSGFGIATETPRVLATSKSGTLLLRRDQGEMAVFWDSRSRRS